MKKNISKIIAIVLVSSMLVACGEKKTTITLHDSETISEASVSSDENKASTENETVASENSSDSTLNSSAETEAEITEAVTSIPEISDDAAFMEYLVGEWMYAKGTDIAGSMARLTINADNTYELAALGEDEDGEEKGTWNLADYFGKKNGVSTLICFHADGGEFSADYFVDEITVIENHYVMSTIQANNGDSLLARKYDDVSPIFIKKDEIKVDTTTETIKNSTFDALIWDAYQDEIFISNLEDDKLITPAVKYSYEFCNENEGLSFRDLFLAPARVETDADGKIVSYQLYRNYDNYVVHHYNTLNSIQGYVYDKKDYTVSDDDGSVTIVAYTNVPRFIGDKKTVDAVNGALQRIADNYAADIDTALAEELKIFEEAEYGGEFFYSPIDVKSIYWDPFDGLVSVCLSWDWFMGGVANHGYYTVNYDPIKEKFVDVYEFMNMAKEDFLYNLEDAFYKQYEMAADFSQLENIKYFVQSECINCVFDSYELSLGNFAQEVEMNRY